MYRAGNILSPIRMSSSAAVSDNTTNPLVQIREVEQQQLVRLQQAKKMITDAEERTTQTIAEAAASVEAKHREKANDELKAFSKTEPVAILQQGTEKSKKQIQDAKKYFESKKEGIISSLVQEFISSNQK